MDEKELEQTLVLIKPDALRNSLTGYVLSQLSEFHTGLRFAGAKIVHVSRMLAEEHYAEHRGKGFFEPVIEYITGGAHYPKEMWKRRVIALVYQGPEAVRKLRDIAGPTNPHKARTEKPGCIRALGTIVPLTDSSGRVIAERIDNLIHASATRPEAEREVKLWFRPCDIPPLMRAFATKTSDEHYYFKAGKLYNSHEPGSVCLIAPGDTVWASDLEAVSLLQKGQAASCSMDCVAAKYLINEEHDVSV